MNSVIDRYRELAGVVESRPAYMVEFDEQTVEDLQQEIDDLIAERKQLEIQLEARGLLEHYRERWQVLDPNLDAKGRRAFAIGKSKKGKAHTIKAHLATLAQPKVPSTAWLNTHHHGKPGGGLQAGDTHEKKTSDDARADHKRIMHSHAAFHHYHAAQAYKALGNEHKADRHLAAAEAHHKRAKVPEGQEEKGGSYMVHAQTGHFTDYAPVYDKKGEKARKNKISKAARKAATKTNVWRAPARTEPQTAADPQTA